jgi:hypothetical protein
MFHSPRLRCASGGEDRRLRYTEWMLVPWTTMIVALLAACAGEKWDDVTVEDEGDLCLYVGDFDPFSTTASPPGTETTFTATAPIVVHYVPLSCFSSSCTQNIEISCEALVTGSDIVIHGTGSWEVASGDQECTADCGLGDGECTIDPLGEGTYTVRFGTETATLTIPSTATVCLQG